jgi:hypothetical protein
MSLYKHLLFALWATTLLPSLGFAQITDTRSQFPGRRVGGGTRGECTSRLIAHLVSPANVQEVAKGKPATIAILEGPAAQTYPLLINLQGLRSYQLEPMATGVRLLILPAITAETRWESSFLCPEAVGLAGDPLGFITTASPPALSLVRPGQGAGSGTLLNRLAASCGSSIPTTEISKFLSVDPLPGIWPEQLPVRCKQL